MNDNIFESYKKTTQEIEVPKELQERTIRLMQENKSTKKFVPRTYVAATAAALAVFVVGGVYFQTNKIAQPELTITESLSADAIDEQVELSKGSLNFAEIPVEFHDTGFNLGGLDGEAVTLSEEEYFSYLGKNPLPAYLPEGLAKQASDEQQLMKNAEGSYTKDEFSIHYASEDGDSLEIVLSALGIPNAKDAAELPESNIDGTSFKVAYCESTNRKMVFLAYFETDGIGYFVRGEGISQEEFIRVILSVF